MSSPITLTGSSGIPTNEIISKLMAIERRPIDLMEAKKQTLNQKQSAYDQIKTLTTNFQSTLNKLKANTAASPDLFNRRKVDSDNAGVVSGTATTAAAAPQAISVEVTQRATATGAKSVGASFQNGVGNIVDASTQVSSVFPGGISNGNFTVYVNGVASTVAIDRSQSLSTVFSNISSATGGVVSGSITAEGKINLSSSGGETITLGANSDTTNFLDATALKGPTPGSSIDSKSLTNFDVNADVTTAAANLRAGAVSGGSTFKIGSASFSVGNKSLNTLIGEINNSAEAGVTASFNSTTNKLELTSKSTGSQYITLEDTTGNFLNQVGLISGGNTTTSQTTGQNASLIVNGSTITSSSNIVGSDISGIAGVTLNINAQAPGSPVNVYVAQDNTALTAAITEFVTNYNNLITSIDSNTNSQRGGVLTGEQGLNFFRNRVRTQVSNRNTDTNPYENLSSIGISTGPVTGSAGNVTSLLQIDSTALQAALDADPGKVKELLVGTNGIITKSGTGLSAIIDDALKTHSDPGGRGLFAAHENSHSERIQQLNRSIDRGEQRLSQKESLLRRQFTAMETAIAKIRSQGNAVASLSSQLGAYR